MTAILGSVLSGTGALVYAGKIEPSWLDTTSVSIPIPHLPPALHDYHIVQVSDIHFDAQWMTAHRLQEIVAAVNALSPDAVVITGDFVSIWNLDCLNALDTSMRALRAPHVIACLGNHDHRHNPLIIAGILEAAGVRVLQNESLTIEHRGARLCFAGLDDYLHHAANLPLLLSRIPEDIPAILLAHEPDIADTTAKTRRFLLQLSGHSHGGQVISPGGRPLVLPTMGKKYPLGLYRVQGMWQYTNRGVGMIPPRVRFNCRPEITSLRLVSA